MSGIKYTLYQLMCTPECYTTTTDNTQRIVDMIHRDNGTVLNGTTLKMVSYCIYEVGGFKQKLDYDSLLFFYGGVGSVHMKCIDEVNGCGVSAMIFKSGKKIKISGGLSKCSVDNKELYMTKVAGDICRYITNCDIDTVTIGLLNAQTVLPLDVIKFKKLISDLRKSTEFFRIQDPTLTGRGKITNARVYPFKNRNTHCAVDPAGVVQMFGFKSFEEVQEIVKKIVNFI